MPLVVPNSFIAFFLMQKELIPRQIFLLHQLRTGKYEFFFLQLNQILKNMWQCNTISFYSI